MLRFRLFGIPFEVAPYFWIISALLSGSAVHGQNAVLLLVVWVLCVFVSIVVHELGHALMARHYGASPLVRLYALGGVTQPGRGFTRGQNLMVVLCGPAAGFGLYLAVRAASGLLRHPAPAVYDFLAGDTPASIATLYAVHALLFINLIWTLFNLLPILPLDGGLILRNVIGYGRENWARMIGMVCAVGCAVWAVSTGWIYGAIFFGFLAYQNFQGGGPLPGSAHQ